MAIEIMEIEEIAKELKCSQRVAAGLLEGDQFRGEKIGNRWKVLREHFEEDLRKYLGGKKDGTN